MIFKEFKVGFFFDKWYFKYLRFRFFLKNSYLYLISWCVNVFFKKGFVIVKNFVFIKYYFIKFK